MPGSNAGTGEPIAFKCAQHRRAGWRNQLSEAKYHSQIFRTGRERPYKPQSQGIRTDHVSREYVCECGHVGWSAHKDLARLPLALDDRSVS